MQKKVDTLTQTSHRQTNKWKKSLDAGIVYAEEIKIE